MILDCDKMSNLEKIELSFVYILDGLHVVLILVILSLKILIDTIMRNCIIS